MVPVNRTINSTAETAAVLTPTQVADFVYCPRLSYLKKRYPTFGPTTFALAYGSFVHELFRTFTTACDTVWRRIDPSTMIMASLSELDHHFQQALKLAKERYPVFYDKIEKKETELRYLMTIWLQQKQKEILQRMKTGFLYEDAVSVALPWKVEETLFSKSLGLYGRTDAIYQIDGALVPEDLKTHNSKVSTMIRMPSFKAQVMCYSVMAEDVFDIPSTSARVFFPNDASTVTFTADKQARAQLLVQLDGAREQLDKDIPPVLEGDQKILCQFCYCKKQCDAVAANDEAWLDRLVQNGGELKLEGGDRQNAN